MVISHGEIGLYGMRFKILWQKNSLFGQPEENYPTRLTNLMKFLNSEVEVEKRLKLARDRLNSIYRKEDYHDKARGGADSKLKF
ncbi:hypothetical protein TNCT_62661 [Trichonephila clavata]|uniref:Uncharacterized protein n=1 Tax=Trichonephila clavata TaxID=2740835 RepID=A0A8X6G8I2_TRICU|nr:hypothetical protein TNCT_62661 [Trichonephila clavata]